MLTRPRKTLEELREYALDVNRLTAWRDELKARFDQRLAHAKDEASMVAIQTMKARALELAIKAIDSAQRGEIAQTVELVDVPNGDYFTTTPTTTPQYLEFSCEMFANYLDREADRLSPSCSGCRYETKPLRQWSESEKDDVWCAWERQGAEIASDGVSYRPREFEGHWTPKCLQMGGPKQEWTDEQEASQ
jgi:hypothetical protein